MPLAITSTTPRASPPGAAERRAMRDDSMSIQDAMADPNLWARWFRNPATYEAWHAFLAATFGQPMTEDQQAIYAACTGRSIPPTAPMQEVWLACGRRSGKSFMLAMSNKFAPMRKLRSKR